MKSLLIAAAAVALTATAAWAQTQSAAGTTTQTNSNYDPNETVCRSIQESGSRLKSARVCMTRAQWVDLQRQQRSDTEVSQNRRVAPR